MGVMNLVVNLDDSVWQNVFRAVVIILIGWMFERLTVLTIRRGIKKTQSQKQKTYLSVITKTLQIAIVLATVFMVMEVFGVKATPMVAVASALSVAFGLGAQQFIKDVIAGFFILSESQYVLGDIVSVAGVTGVVEEVTLRTTIVRNSVSGEQYIISNGDIKMVTNMSRDYRKAVVDVFVPYHFDIDVVIGEIETYLDTIEVIDPLLTKPRFEGVTKLEERYYTLRVSCKTHTNRSWTVESDIRRNIVSHLRKSGITLSSKTREEIQNINKLSDDILE